MGYRPPRSGRRPIWTGGAGGLSETRCPAPRPVRVAGDEIGRPAEVGEEAAVAGQDRAPRCAGRRSGRYSRQAVVDEDVERHEDLEAPVSIPRCEIGRVALERDQPTIVREL